MIKDLQNIFDSITPENIKDVPAIKDAMQIFIETLEDLSKESIDIKNAFENEKIKEELIKVYLDDLYKVIQQVRLNEKLLESIQRVNSFYEEPFLSEDAFTNLVEYIHEEHFLTFKSYKQTKGTPQAIEYIYDLVSSLVTTNNQSSGFEIKEGEPFELDIVGTLPAEFYEYIIYPLAHPAGFNYTYSRIIKDILQDYFRVDVSHTTNQLEVTTLSGNENFIPDQPGVVVDSFTIDEPVTGGTETRVYLSGGAYDNRYIKEFKEDSGQIHVSIHNSINDALVYQYPDQDQPSLIFDYSFDFNTLIEDLATFVDYHNPNKGETYLVNIYSGIAEDNNGLITIGGLDGNGQVKKIGGGWVIGNGTGTTLYDSEGYAYFKNFVDADPVNLQFETEDTIDVGVYRNGSLLPDNNLSAISGPATCTTPDFNTVSTQGTYDVDGTSASNVPATISNCDYFTAKYNGQNNITDVYVQVDYSGAAPTDSDLTMTIYNNDGSQNWESPITITPGQSYASPLADFSETEPTYFVIQRVDQTGTSSFTFSMSGMGT